MNFSSEISALRGLPSSLSVLLSMFQFWDPGARKPAPKRCSWTTSRIICVDLFPLFSCAALCWIFGCGCRQSQLFIRFNQPVCVLWQSFQRDSTFASTWQILWKCLGTCGVCGHICRLGTWIVWSGILSGHVLGLLSATGNSMCWWWFRCVRWGWPKILLCGDLVGWSLKRKMFAWHFGGNYVRWRTRKIFRKRKDLRVLRPLPPTAFFARSVS